MLTPPLIACEKWSDLRGRFAMLLVRKGVTVESVYEFLIQNGLLGYIVTEVEWREENKGYCWLLKQEYMEKG